MSDQEKSIIIGYAFSEIPHGDAPSSVQINVNVHKETSEEEVAQILIRAYQTVASRVLQKHIVSGCPGCIACRMNEDAMRGIDRALAIAKNS